MQFAELILLGQQLRGATALDILDLLVFFAMLLSPCAVALRCVLLAELSADAGLPPPEEVLFFKRMRQELFLPLQAAFRLRILEPLQVHVAAPFQRQVAAPARSWKRAVQGTAWLHARALLNSARGTYRIRHHRLLSRLRLRRRLLAGGPVFDLHGWVSRRRQGRSATGRA